MQYLPVSFITDQKNILNIYFQASTFQCYNLNYEGCYSGGLWITFGYLRLFNMHSMLGTLALLHSTPIEMWLFQLGIKKKESMSAAMHNLKCNFLSRSNSSAVFYKNESPVTNTMECGGVSFFPFYGQHHHRWYASCFIQGENGKYYMQHTITLNTQEIWLLY